MDCVIKKGIQEGHNVSDSPTVIPAILVQWSAFFCRLSYFAFIIVSRPVGSSCELQCHNNGSEQMYAVKIRSQLQLIMALLAGTVKTIQNIQTCLAAGWAGLKESKQWKGKT